MNVVHVKWTYNEFISIWMEFKSIVCGLSLEESDA